MNVNSIDVLKFAQWCGGTWKIYPVLRIEKFTNDTRTLNRGDVFFALKGKCDGHEFLVDAFKKFAAAVVIDKFHEEVTLKIANNFSTGVLVVDDVLTSMQNAARMFRINMLKKVIAVTGSAGKTTVKDLIAVVLSSKFSVTKTPGNFNNHIGVPLSILNSVPYSDFAVYEIGTSKPGEIAFLSRIVQPDIGVITTIGPAHIEFFSSIENIAIEKGSLFEVLPSDGMAVIDKDIDYYKELVRRARCRVITVGIKSDADYIATSISNDFTEFTIVERSTGEKFSIVAEVPAEHWIRNILLAIAIARQFQIDRDDIKMAISSFKPSSMRWEKISLKLSLADRCFKVLVINDAYNSNPLSAKASITAFLNMKIQGRKWLILGDMLELGKESVPLHEEFGDFLIKKLKGCDLNKIGGIILKGELMKNVYRKLSDIGVNCYSFNGIEDIVNFLVDNLIENDALFLKASRAIGLERVLDLLLKYPIEIQQKE